MKHIGKISISLFSLISITLGYFLWSLKTEAVKHHSLIQNFDTPLVKYLEDENQEIIVEKSVKEPVKAIPEAKKFFDSHAEKDVLSKNQQNYITYDNDSSIDKFVGPNNPFYDVQYVPEDLVALDEEHILDKKGTAQMRKEAAREFQNLAKAFFEEFDTDIIVVSTYRSYEYQKRIKDGGCPDNLCSKAGHSEHQSGLAIDLWETTNYSQFMAQDDLKKYYEWMLDHASEYGFHNSYQKGKAIDGYDREPWHWRYVGVDLAKELESRKITLTEFNSLPQ